MYICNCDNRGNLRGRTSKYKMHFDNLFHDSRECQAMVRFGYYLCFLIANIAKFKTYLCNDIRKFILPTPVEKVGCIPFPTTGIVSTRQAAIGPECRHS